MAVRGRERDKHTVYGREVDAELEWKRERLAYPLLRGDLGPKDLRISRSEGFRGAC